MKTLDLLLLAQELIQFKYYTEGAEYTSQCGAVHVLVQGVVAVLHHHGHQEMLKSWKGFDTSVKLCRQANSAGKTARYKSLLETLQTTYYKFEEDYEFYKNDAIKKIFKTEDAFNANVDEDGVEVAACPNNDAWSDVQMMR